jgi:tRNA threonylcarbamoyladenosine biosynthesis protein TsaB
MGACSAALWSDGDIVARRFTLLQRGHAEALVPMLEEVRAAAGGLAYQDVDYFAVTVGPGTFTGIRVGLATARGLGLAAARPVVGITTLEAIAAAAMAAESERFDVTLAVIDARRNEVYAQAFDSRAEPLWPPSLLSLEVVAERISEGEALLAGTGAPAMAVRLRDAGRVCRLAGEESARPDAAHVVRRAALRIESAPGKTWLPPAPLYIRPPDARLPDTAR